MKPIAYRINWAIKSTGLTILGQLRRITAITTPEYIHGEIEYLNYKFPNLEHWLEYIYPEHPDFEYKE